MDYEWLEACNSQVKCSWQDAAAGMDSTRRNARQEPMAFRVERLLAGDVVVLRVSVRIDAENVDTLRELMKQEEGKVAIDLKEVTRINLEAVRFLALSERNGVELRNCADYIGEWITRERRRK